VSVFVADVDGWLERSQGQGRLLMTYGVLFDMDGVLVDSAGPHHESWRVLAERHAVGVSEEEFRGCFGRRSQDIIRLLWGGELADEEVAALDAEKEAIYRELIAGQVPLMAGCVELLAALRGAGYRVAVATSGPRENLEMVLREGALAAYFDATVHGGDVSHGKPAPDCFLLAAERIAVAPARCVVIEDAPVGIEAGVTAGMPVIAVEGTHPPERLREAGAARVVPRLADVTVAGIGELVRDGRGES
jgi:HAD superfamily hydrolase (TIGR01509 family)